LLSGVPGTLLGTGCVELSGATPAAIRFPTWDPREKYRWEEFAVWDGVE
jgi:hypothetical protein